MYNAAAFAPYPPAAIRLSIAPEEWATCVEAWLELTSLILRLPEIQFHKIIFDTKYGVVGFVTSYVQQESQSQTRSRQLNHKSSLLLHKSTFILCHRILSSPRIPAELTCCAFLAQFAGSYHSVASLPGLLLDVWTNHAGSIEFELKDLKKSVVTQLDSGDISSWQPTLQQLNPLIKACPSLGSALALGTDLIDSLAGNFSGTNKKLLQTLTIFTYLLLLSLSTAPKPSYTVLTEHLYTLKVNAKVHKSKGTPSLLVAIASDTPLIRNLQGTLSSGPNATASKNSGASPQEKIAASLREFVVRKQTQSKQKRPQNTAATNHAVLEDAHFHRMSKVLHIQEMLPDLGSGFITKILREYDDDEENVLNHLLNDSLPPHLADADRAEQLADENGITVEDMEVKHATEPRSYSPRSNRRSKFDGDELDNLTVATTRLHIGKARQDLTADSLLETANPNKTAIYNSLSAFDADDDERDDTYDETDVGGTVDNTMDTDRDSTTNTERILYQTWKSSPQVFGRDSGTRATAQRVKLKQDTKWTDEQIEGWAFMLEREPRRKQNLERRFGNDWHGEQKEVTKTSWTASKDELDDSDDQPGSSQSRGRPHRGRGSFSSGRGRGNTAGPSKDADTQRARRGKEVRGSNLRKAGRAKKLARGSSGT